MGEHVSFVCVYVPAESDVQVKTAFVREELMYFL